MMAESNDTEPKIIIEDLVKCLICDKMFNQITTSHLKKHEISIAEYLKRFPNSLLITASATAKKSLNIIKIKNGRKYTAWNKGISASEEQKQKQSETMKQKFQSGEIIHWNKDKHWDDETKNKISNSLLGHTYWNDDALTKRNETIAEKIRNGWINPLRQRKLTGVHLEKSKLSISKASKIKSNNSLVRVTELVNAQNIDVLEYTHGKYFLNCKICNTLFTRNRGYFFDSCKYSKSQYCPLCFPKQKITSNAEKELFDFIKENYNNAVIPNDRKLLEGKEIDIFIPDKMIGFEYTGLYWHSEINYDFHKLHLLHKTQFAIKKGIQLITIFEDEWLNQKDIIKSRILHILGISTKKIPARKCIIKEIDTKTKNEFLENNHIQGLEISKYRYGAYHNDELIGVMTFNKKENNFELSRFAVKSNYSSVGLASKLFHHFIKNIKPDKIISYADKRWSNGNLYKKLNFKFDKLIQPSYWYTSDYKHRLYKGMFRLEKLKNKLENFDPFLSEWENMQSHGYDRIWDCGMSKWMWTNPNSQDIIKT